VDEKLVTVAKNMEPIIINDRNESDDDELMLSQYENLKNDSVSASPKSFGSVSR